MFESAVHSSTSIAMLASARSFSARSPRLTFSLRPKTASSGLVLEWEWVGPPVSLLGRRGLWLLLREPRRDDSRLVKNVLFDARPTSEGRSRPPRRSSRSARNLSCWCFRWRRSSSAACPSSSRLLSASSASMRRLERSSGRGRGRGSSISTGTCMKVVATARVRRNLVPVELARGLEAIGTATPGLGFQRNAHEDANLDVGATSFHGASPRDAGGAALGGRAVARRQQRRARAVAVPVASELAAVHGRAIAVVSRGCGGRGDGGHIAGGGLEAAANCA